MKGREGSVLKGVIGPLERKRKIWRKNRRRNCMVDGETIGGMEVIVEERWKSEARGGGRKWRNEGHGEKQ